MGRKVTSVTCVYKSVQIWMHLASFSGHYDKMFYISRKNYFASMNYKLGKTDKCEACINNSIIQEQILYDNINITLHFFWRKNIQFCHYVHVFMDITT